MPEVRYFFASFPAAAELQATLQRIQNVQGEYHPTLASKLHMTWAYVATRDAVDHDIEQRAELAGGQVTCSGFAIEFDRMELFGVGRGRRPCVFVASRVPAPLALAASELHARCATGDSRTFRPHVTWARAQALTPSRIEPLRWFVTSLVLVRSVAGAREYECLRRWDLR